MERGVSYKNEKTKNQIILVLVVGGVGESITTTT